MMAADERRGTESGRGKAPYRWSQETSSLPKCKTTTLHGRQWLKNVKHHPSIKNNPRCTPQKQQTKASENNHTIHSFIP